MTSRCMQCGGNLRNNARGIKGGSLASDVLCNKVESGAYDSMSHNSTDLLRVNVMRGGELQRSDDYTIHNQKGGETCTTPSDTPLNLSSASLAVPPLGGPASSGSSMISYENLPSGVLSSLIQPLGTVQAAQNNIVFPSYYQSFSPYLKGGKAARKICPSTTNKTTNKTTKK